jgi:heme exporter protein C
MKPLWAATIVLVFAAFCAIHAAPPAQIEAGSMAQKIFYVHVASAWTTFLAFLIAAGYGIAHLISEGTGGAAERVRSARCYAAVEVGFVFCTYVIVSGPIWAKPVWGVWWRWEPRLTTFLILWATYAACLVLRASLDRPPIRDRAVSVYSILAAVEIPIVLASVAFWRPEAQFHPPRIGLAPEFLKPLWLSVAALTALFFLLWTLRSRICIAEERAR